VSAPGRFDDAPKRSGIEPPEFRAGINRTALEALNIDEHHRISLPLFAELFLKRVLNALLPRQANGKSPLTYNTYL
jgi:hypothetical protein